MKTSVKSSRLRAYGALALSSTALLATHADAATVVDVNAASFDTTFSGIGTVSPLIGSDFMFSYSYVQTSSPVFVPQGEVFRRGTDTEIFSLRGGTQFMYAESYFTNPAYSVGGAHFNSSDNWMMVMAQSDPNQQVWLQIQFGDGKGNGFSIVKAVYQDGPGEISSAFDAANASAIPEPSALALLTLGAGGLLIRRRKKAA